MDNIEATGLGAFHEVFSEPEDGLPMKIKHSTLKRLGACEEKRRDFRRLPEARGLLDRYVEFSNKIDFARFCTTHTGYGIDLRWACHNMLSQTAAYVWYDAERELEAAIYAKGGDAYNFTHEKVGLRIDTLWKAHLTGNLVQR